MSNYYNWKMFPLCIILLAISMLVVTCKESGQGSCPPMLPVEVCSAACGFSKPCNNTQLCCPTACGGAMCVDPMTKRVFVNNVKNGRCPEYPRGPWVCTNTCTGDYDCPRTLKCCTNRCGAFTCQKPEIDEESQTTPPKNA